MCVDVFVRMFVCALCAYCTHEGQKRIPWNWVLGMVSRSCKISALNTCATSSAPDHVFETGCSVVQTCLRLIVFLVYPLNAGLTGIAVTPSYIFCFFLFLPEGLKYSVSLFYISSLMLESPLQLLTISIPVSSFSSVWNKSKSFFYFLLFIVSCIYLYFLYFYLICVC